MKQFPLGAEAVVRVENGKVVKERISKSYRHPSIDFKLRRLRTRREAKLLQKAGSFVPQVEDVDEKKMTITMSLLEGDLLRDVLAKLGKKEFEKVLVSLGKHIGSLHGKNIIHGDLTTSNVIVKGEEVYLIDFGLGCVSDKIEDKAVDLHLLGQALESKHHDLPN